MNNVNLPTNYDPLLPNFSKLSMNQRVFSCRSLAITSLATGTILGGGYYYANAGPPYPQETTESPAPWNSPSRDEMTGALAKGGPV